MKERVLIAGIGNIFLGDDGFGVEVIKRLGSENLPGWVRVTDFGIRGVHLAYEMLDGGYETTIMVDTTRRGGEPGTVYLIEPDIETLEPREPVSLDAHGMDPQAVLGALKLLGGATGRVYVVGCEPLQTEEEIGLSPPVARGVLEAIELIHEIVASLDDQKNKGNSLLTGVR
jgi:hydrogenase maturation protease